MILIDYEQPERNIFAWKREDFEPQNARNTRRGIGGGTSDSVDSEYSVVKICLLGNLDLTVKTFCATPWVLAFLKDYILFAEKDEELIKYILRQHQMGGVEMVVGRPLDPVRTRGVVWNTRATSSGWKSC